jgi:SAM-dependent MidA family methyltransferase
MIQELNAFIKTELNTKKVSFYDFMTWALYHPKWGYYSRKAPQIGLQGDFYTSPHVHPAFGYCIADQLFQMWKACGSPKKFSIVEAGPGTGLLARDILEYIEKYHDDLYQALSFYLIESSSYLTAVQQSTLGQFSLKCIWATTLQQTGLRNMTGVILSNEFVDALPVRKLRIINGKPMESYIKFEDGVFAEKYMEVSDHEVLDYLKRLGISFAEGQQLEVNLDVLHVLLEVSQVLGKGFVITIDYGYLAGELREPFRHDGTLMSYKNHCATQDVLSNPGEQDITAHVNFSALMDYGKDFGIETTGYTTQMRFLINLGVLEKARNNSASIGQNAKHTLAVKRLIMPEGMGERFKVLIQHKGLKNPDLKGIKGFFDPLK